jgi:hypothetical protein
VVKKKLAKKWKGPLRVIKTDENILKVQASPRSKIIAIHVNRVQLFHNFKDIVTIPTQPDIENPAQTPDILTEEEDEDDYEGLEVNEQVEEDGKQVEEAVLPVQEQAEEVVLPIPVS